VVKAIHEKVRTMTDDRIIFLVLSDGSPAGENYGSEEDIKDFKRIVERAKRDEFVTVGIYIQYAGVKDMYNYHTVIQDMDEMPKKVSHILNKVVKSEFQ
jgi:nitric oxide reductase activation protein